MDPSTRTRIEARIREFADEHARGKQPDFARYCELEGEDCDADYICGLVVEDILGRATKGQTPWIDSYLIPRVHRHRASLCVALNDELYSDDGKLARQLGVLEIGPYVTQRLVGFGGFGSVFLASRTDAVASSNGQFAVKVAHPSRPRCDDLLENEARVLKQLNEQFKQSAAGLPTFLDFGKRNEQSLYLATDFVDGVSLSEWLRTDPEPNLRWRVCRRLGELVEHLHNEGVFHGDISADNILISHYNSDPQPHLIDFASSGKRFRTDNLPLLFTIGYAAPELVSSTAEPTDRSDMWSLAVLVYEILSGEHPFGDVSDGATLADWKLQLRRAAGVPVPPAWTDPLRAWIRDCLVEDPKQRHAPTPAHLVAALPKETDRYRPTGSNDLPSSDLNALCATYLQRVMTRLGSITIPVVDPSHRDRKVPIDALVVDLPLFVEDDVEHRHEDDRSRAGLKSFSERVASRILQTKERKSNGPFGLGACLAKHNAMVLVGAPGCGKSTLFALTAYRYAASQLERLTNVPRQHPDPLSPTIVPEMRVPVVLICRDMSKIEEGCTLGELIARQLLRWGFSDEERAILGRHLSAEISHERAIILVDGLDEIASPESRRYVCRLLNDVVVASRVKLFATSRPIGFNFVKQDLSDCALLVVGPLLPEQRKLYVRRWAAFDPDAQEELLTQHVCENTRLERLTETMLMLALLVQMCGKERFLPNRRVDVFRDVGRIMLENQRRGKRDEMLFNEVWPHLEHLAFRMRAEESQRLVDTRVVRHFADARKAEPDELDMQRRTPIELLYDIIDHLQVLNVVGVEIEKATGAERRSVQFFHQSLQEYFAGRAINHNRGGATGSDAVERIRRILIDSNGAMPVLVDREIASVGSGLRIEPVIAEYWHEAIAMAVAQLERHDADRAIREILGLADLDKREKRARTVLAMHCLAEDPPVSDSTVDLVFSALGDTFIREDGFNTEINTLMDSELTAIASGRWGQGLRSRLLDDFRSRTDEQKQRLGSAYLTAVQNELPMLDAGTASAIIAERAAKLRSGNEAERTVQLLELVHVFYSSQPKTHLDYLTLGDRQQIVPLLVSCAIDTDHSVSMAAMWALRWLLRSRSWKPIGCQWLSELEMEPLVGLIADIARDGVARQYAAEILGTRHGDTPSLAQPAYRNGQYVGDWIYGLAVMADGQAPQCSLRQPDRSDRDGAIGVLLACLGEKEPRNLRTAVAVSLGRLGVFPSEANEPLIWRIEDDLYIEAERDEAVLYLALSRTPRAAEYFAKEMRSDLPTDKYLPDRAMFGIIAHGCVDTLRSLLLDTHTRYREECARTLAGLADPRGRETLLDLRAHASPDVRKAVAAALRKAEKWAKEETR